MTIINDPAAYLLPGPWQKTLRKYCLYRKNNSLSYRMIAIADRAYRTSLFDGQAIES